MHTIHTLRAYQSLALNEVIEHLFDSPVLVSPTGSGKTTMASHLVKRAGGRTLWVAHRDELISQAASHLHRTGLMVGRLGEVEVASIQSKPDPKGYALVIIDEAHRAAASSYQRLFGNGIPVVGLTATPFRLDGRGLGDLFGRMVVAAQPADLAADGEPCDLRPLWQPTVYSFPSVDMAGAKIKDGDYTQKAIDEALNRGNLMGDVVNEWLDRAEGVRTVVFAASVAHSQQLAAAFRAHGVAAEHVDGTTPEDTRAAILRRLETGETTVVCNVLLLTEGWDLPALGCVVLARPTASLCIHLQTVGRVLRAAPGKRRALVLDHAGNHLRHGSVLRRLEYRLDGAPSVVNPTEALGLRRCLECFMMMPMSAGCCPGCGVGVAKQSREADKMFVFQAGRLAEFTPRDHEFQSAWFAALVAENKGEAYARAEFKERFGREPLVIGGVLFNAEDKSQENKRRLFNHLIGTQRTKGYADGWSNHRFREIFGVAPRGFVAQVRGYHMPWRGVPSNV